VGDITGFVLAGGKSSRMGQDKALLELAGRTLLERAMALVRSVTPEVWIVGSSTKFEHFGTVVEDAHTNRGPLGGIHAALRSTRSELNLLLAVDLPFVEAPFLAYLAKTARESDAMVTVVRDSGHWQPLCAVYRRSFGVLAEEALLQRKNKIDALFKEAKTRVIDEDEMTVQGFNPAMFHNLNTPEDWRAAEQILGKHDASR
jgi:molybdopterin-guanine dinucleotide biosynthesis protein A